MVILLIAVNLISQTALEPEFGTGTEENPYQINSLGNLYWIAASNEEVSEPEQSIRWASHYIQTADIEAQDTVNWFNGKGWTPIGKSWEEPFSGTYDGGWHTIDNLFINRPDEVNVALFGYTAGMVTVAKLGLTNVNITGYEAVGAIVGICMDHLDIINSFSTGSVNGVERVGGVVGDLRASYIINCSSSVIIYGTDSVGGLTGSIAKSLVKRSCSKGEIIGGTRTGGLVGTINQSGVIDCFSRVSVRGSHSVGGLVGILDLGSIENSYSSGVVVADYDFGGLIGELFSISYLVENSYWDIESSGISVSPAGEGRTTEEMTYPYAGNTYVDWDFEEIWMSDESQSINDGYPYLQDVVLSADDISQPVVSSLTLRNYPNPFNPETTVIFTLSRQVSYLKLKIINSRGRLVRILIAGRPHNEGEYRIAWDGKNESGEQVGSGVYYCLLTTPDFVAAKKMLLIK